MPTIHAVLIAVFLSLAESKPAHPSVDYLTDIKPILTAKCYGCHSALRQESGLRVDAAQLLKKGGESGPAIVPGKATESLLLDALTGANGASRMPQDAEPLSAEEIARFRQWIDAGAAAPEEKIPDDPRKHWAFVRPVRSALPTLAKGSAWARNPIDVFVAAEHERLGLRPVSEASKPNLLRRVYLDLVGVPPTRDELNAFLADTSAHAYERVVDRLLASPLYGQRWGRHWMDVWRYSDWAGWGDQVRDSQPHIWQWREWIVDSLGADKGYDQMMVEMLAGDELAPTDPDSLRATGFLVRNYKRLSREAWLQDTVNHTSKAFLAITMDCARCHDHRYDPVSQREYYSMRAIFEPHNVRIDPLPGVTDVTKTGLPRAFDADLATPTFLFVRGDDRNPDKSAPIPPGVPSLFAPRLEMTPISLAPPVYYPGLTDIARKAELESAAKALEDARAAVAKATAAAGKGDTGRARLLASREGQPGGSQDASQLGNAAAAEPNDDAPALELEAANRQLVAAEANQASLLARIAADDARFAVPTDARYPALASVASKTERLAKFYQAEANAAQLRAQPLTPNARKTKKKAVAVTPEKLAEADKAVVEARKALEGDGSEYSPIGSVYPATSTGRRLAFAQWMVSKENPLTARVAVNHIWLRHFGQALVPTVFDFGLNGKRPTHPRLLDWLAVELQDAGWSTKHLHRLIVTSATYRLASTAGSATPANVAADPDNVFYWKSPARRMEAEVVRDSILHAAGRLDVARGGPDLDNTQWSANRRRSLYFRHAQEKQMTFLKLFDGPAVTECYVRKQSIIPQQALAMANSELTLVNGRSLARTLSNQVGDGNPAFVTAAFEQVLARPATDDESSRCVAFLADQERKHQGQQGGAASDGSRPAAEPRQRARESLIHVLLNHNDFVTIR